MLREIFSARPLILEKFRGKAGDKTDVKINKVGRGRERRIPGDDVGQKGGKIYRLKRLGWPHVLQKHNISLST